MVGGLLEGRQPRLVSVAMGRGTPQVRVPASPTAATGGPVAPRGRRGLSLHHVWSVRCPLVNSRFAEMRTAASRSCLTFTSWITHRKRQDTSIVHICDDSSTMISNSEPKRGHYNPKHGLQSYSLVRHATSKPKV